MNDALTPSDYGNIFFLNSDNNPMGIVDKITPEGNLIIVGGKSKQQILLNHHIYPKHTKISLGSVITFNEKEILSISTMKIGKLF